MKEFIVTEKAQRPADINGCCFYCQQPIGTPHKPDCVLINKKVKIRMTVEYFVEVPNHWTAHDIEFHRNESSWCAGNVIPELEELDDKEKGCLCRYTRFEYIGEESEPYLSEE